jgi:hypothetical protein
MEPTKTKRQGRRRGLVERITPIGQHSVAKRVDSAIPEVLRMIKENRRRDLAVKTLVGHDILKSAIMIVPAEICIGRIDAADTASSSRLVSTGLHRFCYVVGHWSSTRFDR